jgi:ribosomal-protein-alanine N-acetyltransferase
VTRTPEALEPVIRTARLDLRRFTAEDAPTAFSTIYGDAEVMRHVGTGPLRTVAETEALLRRYAEAAPLSAWTFWAVIERETGRLIGDAGLWAAHPVPGPPELGYTLARDAWGKGYATEAAGGCVKHAFKRPGIRELCALAEPANTASLHVLGKLGFVDIGTRRVHGRVHRELRLRR